MVWAHLYLKATLKKKKKKGGKLRSWIFLFEYSIQQIYELKQLLFFFVKSKLPQDFPSIYTICFSQLCLKFLASQYAEASEHYWGVAGFFCKLYQLCKLHYSQELIFVKEKCISSIYFCNMVMNGESIICNGGLGEQPEIGLILLNDKSVYFSVTDCVHWVKRCKTKSCQHKPCRIFWVQSSFRAQAEAWQVRHQQHQRKLINVCKFVLWINDPAHKNWHFQDKSLLYPTGVSAVFAYAKAEANFSFFRSNEI